MSHMSTLNSPFIHVYTADVGSVVRKWDDQSHHLDILFFKKSISYVIVSVDVVFSYSPVTLDSVRNPEVLHPICFNSISFTFTFTFFTLLSKATFNIISKRLSYHILLRVYQRRLALFAL